MNRCNGCEFYNQKAENEHLQDILVKSNNEIAKQEAEIERLKAGVNVELDNFASEYDSKIKAEAYKEFAEEIKNALEYISYDDGYFTCISKAKIDNLLKEMIGE